MKFFCPTRGDGPTRTTTHVSHTSHRPDVGIRTPNRSRPASEVQNFTRVPEGTYHVDFNNETLPRSVTVRTPRDEWVQSGAETSRVGPKDPSETPNSYSRPVSSM